ncbi:HNH endonuclease [Myceligenerans salitolerans]|uniref:HNH endonuclease n=2 Tax=Myceligenerans salitolerans TaxID=1230528 RepID=A0ABS3I910_9MICO|nr:HNH endonuclease [Myceligenerans salitolerans]
MQAQPATTSSSDTTTQPGPRRLRTALVAASAALLVLAALTVPGTAHAYPPDMPSKSQVQSELNAITVRAEGPRTGYSRSLFPHWTSQGGNCNTREAVLRRDGRNVTVGTDCYPTSGSWYSEFDGQTRTVPSQISVDHVVALAEAWDSGASSWSTSRRQAFANDLSGPQLIAVTTEVNSSKSDKDIAEWVPPLSSKRCAFAKMVIHTKYRWDLSMDPAEKSAAQTYLNYCSY